jgi:hypothetical protein
VNNADLDSWKQVLCALVVYCQQDRRLKLAGQSNITGKTLVQILVNLVAIWLRKF